MSPRRLDLNLRAALIEAAARLIAEGGPAALSTRRLATEAGTSTMAVYTYFGSMGELVREIVHDGFARLEQGCSLVELTHDPVAERNPAQLQEKSNQPHRRTRSEPQNENLGVGRGRVPRVAHSAA